MNVTLLNDLNHTFPDIPYVAARRSRGAEPEESRGHTYHHKMSFLVELFKLGHKSVFEHSSVSFDLAGISRSCFDQLNRYRHASMCMESQRHCPPTHNKLIIPDSIANNEEALKMTLEHAANTEATYKELLTLGIPKEDARYIAEMGRSSSEVFTCNLREFFWIRQERLCSSAQWEIRELVRHMSTEIIEQCPDMYRLFALARPHCETCATNCNNKWKGV